MQLLTKRLSFGRRGRLKSLDLNTFMSTLITDLSAFVTEVNSNRSNRVEDLKKIKDEFLSMRGEIMRLRELVDNEQRSNGYFGLRIPHVLSMYDLSKVSFLSAASAAVRASVSPVYGQATVPVNNVENRFFTLDFRTNEVVPPESLNVSVTGTFDKALGDGLIDYEYAGDVDEGDATLAFNGMNTHTWVRTVSFPLESDVDSVECELTVQVPTQSNLVANAIVVHPHPWKDVDITGLYTSSDLGTSFTAVPGFTELLGAENVRIFFPDQQVNQIKIRLRQRNWRQENGLKVFRYGMEELALQLIDWDKTYDASKNSASNHTVVYRVDAPPGMVFNTLEAFWSSPDFTLEDSVSRHLHFKIASDANGDTILWNSDTTALPQNQTSGVALGREHSSLYVLSTMNWVSSSGGAGSPFAVGTTPFIENIGLTYTVVPE